MTFDSYSLERLRELARKLPKPLPIPNNKKEDSNQSTKKQKLHPLETENNPEKLFKEIVQASPDGNIPSHLIKRLKEVESLHRAHISNQNINPIGQPINESKSSLKNKNLKAAKEGESLYSAFQRLLLEEEEDAI